MCVSSFSFVTLTILDKSVTKIYLITGWKEWRKDKANPVYLIKAQYFYTYISAQFISQTNLNISAY